MRMLLRFFAAFCVATIIAQAIILTLAAMRGNIHSDTFARAIALVNGIDITGDRLKKALDDSQHVPIPTYEDVLRERARQGRSFIMREQSIIKLNEETQTLQAKLEAEQLAFDRRRKEFFDHIDNLSKNLVDESLKEVQRTLEVLGPEQAKDQLLRMVEADRMDDVVAILKGMPLDKRKKVVGEFVDEVNDEPGKLHQILTRLREGEPTASLIENARKEAAPAS